MSLDRFQVVVVVMSHVAKSVCDHLLGVCRV